MKSLIKRYIFLAIVMLSAHSVLPNDFWRRDYSKVDSIALTVTPGNNLEQLTASLTKHFHTDLEKYRAIFTWIAHHIAYDCAAYNNQRKTESGPEEVLKNRKAVCEGYSNLFSKMCELSNLEYATISGWTKNVYAKIGKPLNENTTHAWNAIKIEGDWYLCDVTWASGSPSDDCKTFSFDFKGAYFCTPPDLFAYKHYPQDNKWFLGAEVSKKRFVENPHFYYMAIESELKKLKPADGSIRYKKGAAIKFNFQTKRDVAKVLIGLSNAKFATAVEFKRHDNEIEFYYTLQSYSPYLFIYLNGNAVLVYRVIK